MTRFKNNSRSMYSGPLSKMVKDAVEEHMSALKSEHMSDWEKISSETTELDMSKDPRYKSGTTTTDTFRRQGEDDPYEGEKVDSDTWQKLYDEAMQGGGSKGMQEYVKKYNIDGTAKAEYKQETRTDLNPAELEQIQRKEVDKIDVDESKERKPEYVSAEIPDRSLASIFNLNPDRAGFMTSHAAEFFDQKFSVDNPTFDVLKDNKFMKKARKEYEKSMKGAGNRKRMTLPFERWVMQSYRPGGSGDTLINQARTWQRDNPMDDDGSHMENPDGSEAIIRTTPKGTRGNRNRPDQPSWYDKADVEGGETTAAPKLKFANPKHPLNKRTMSFRRKR